jgi:phosphoribosylformylglycinamidine (FGAM) synthase PurS component
MSRTAFLLLAAFAAVSVQAASKPGTSCVEFDSSICDKQPDGVFFENIADCGSPFCHTTYVVCYSGAPTVQNCAEDTVWSQEESACINRFEGPGGCPATCGLLNGTICHNKPNGFIRNNPTDCGVRNRQTTYIYCTGHTGIVANCPSDTYFNATSSACVDKDGAAAELTAFRIPGMAMAPASEPTMAPAPAPMDDEDILEALAPATFDDELYMIEDDEEVETPMIAPLEAPVFAPAPAPMVYEPANFTVALAAKELLDLEGQEIQAALKDVTGMRVDSAEPSKMAIKLDLAMDDFDYALDDEAKQDISVAVEKLLADALGEYVSADDITVVDVSEPISTASAEMGGTNSVTATVMINPADNERQTIEEVVQALPEFETLFAQALTKLGHKNNTAEELGISEDVAEYLHKNSVQLNDHVVEAEVTITHTSGEEGNAKLEQAIQDGTLSKELSEVLGEQVTTEVAVPAPAPAPEGTRDIVIETNSGAAFGASMAAALAGAFVTMAMLL